MRTDSTPDATLITATASASPRVRSEDRVLVEHLPEGVLVVAADGAGGLSGGARAADVFVEHVRGRVTSGFAGTSETAWTALLLDADAHIANDPAAGETTGVALLVMDGMIFGASVGDSEAWLVTGDNYDVLTVDQNRKRMGSGLAASVAVSAPLGSGTLLVATDGLFGYAKPEAMCEAVRRNDPHEAAERLVALVRLPSGGLADDVGIVVVAGGRTHLR